MAEFVCFCHALLLVVNDQGCSGLLIYLHIKVEERVLLHVARLVVLTLIYQWICKVLGIVELIGLLYVHQGELSMLAPIVLLCLAKGG